MTEYANGSKFIKRLLIIAGSVAVIAVILFMLRVSLGTYAYRAQGFPMPVKNYKSNDSISIPGFLASPSTDTTPVLITLNHATNLHIPRNYLFDAASVNPWPDMRMTVMTTYPDFGGADAATVKMGVQKLYESDKVIIVTRVPDMSVDFVTANISHWMDRMSKEVGPLSTNPTLQEGGSAHYVKFRGSSSNSLLIHCPAGSNRRLTITDFCEVYVAVAPDFVVTYQFRPPLLPHWQEIDDGVMKLLNSFVGK